jgi:hypothetical protein
MPTGEIISSLSSLDPIGLDAIASVKFMNRIDTKYVIPVGKIVNLIELLDSKYKVLEIEKTRALPYHTTYLDTPDYFFYNQHVKGKLERYKIRYRKYEISNSTFLEVKMTTNKRRTLKWRIANQYIPGSFDETAVNFIGEHLSINSAIVKPVLINRFIRSTLIGLESNERITIDHNISFSETVNGNRNEMPYLAIVELKSERSFAASPFKKIMRQLKIYPTGFSKYCIGNALLNDPQRKSRIKPKLLLLNKIEHEQNESFHN